MLMSVIEGALSAPAYPELAGKRILITGLTSRCGVDIARGFAEHRGRLVLQFAEVSTAMETVAELVAPDALEVKAYGPVEPQAGDVAAFAKQAIAAYGGLDAVINLVPLDAGGIKPLADLEEIERIIAGRMMLPLVLSKIAANRMNVTWTEGLILNVATLDAPARGAGQAFASIAKAGLTAMTRAQAEEWAPRAIRFNAVAPQASPVATEPGLCGEPDIAALALYLASGRGRTLSGCVFEAQMR